MDGIDSGVTIEHDLQSQNAFHYPLRPGGDTA